MASLYVTTQGARINRSSRRLVVATDDRVLQSVRLGDLDRLVLMGNVALTTPVMRALLERGVETTFLTQGGRLLGSLRPPGAKNVFLRVQQVRRQQCPEFRLRVAQSMITAKVRNSRRVLQLFGRRREGLDITPALRALKKCGTRIESARGIPQLMGMEGDAAATYFRAYGALFLGEMSFRTVFAGNFHSHNSSSWCAISRGNELSHPQQAPAEGPRELSA